MIWYISFQILFMSFIVCLQQRERKKKAKEQTDMDSAAIFNVSRVVCVCVRVNVLKKSFRVDYQVKLWIKVYHIYIYS